MNQNNYRIIEKTMQDGRKVFVPQYKLFGIWKKFSKPYLGPRYGVEKETIEEAIEFIYSFEKNVLSHTIKSTKIINL